MSADGDREESATATRRAEREPTIYDVVELPESEKGDTCPMMVGERDDIEICGNPAECLFVYEASVKPGDDRRKNCLVCEDCKPGVTARV